MEYVQTLIDGTNARRLRAEFIMKSAAISAMCLIRNAPVSFQVYSITILQPKDADGSAPREDG